MVKSKIMKQKNLDGNIDANENIDQNRITSTPAFTLRILQDNKIF